MQRLRLSSFGLTAAVVAGFLGTSLASTPVRATDSLATPMAGRTAPDLWPVSLAISITSLGEGEEPGRTERVDIAEGQALRVEDVRDTPRGRAKFELQVVAWRHPDAIELEWDLEVLEATYRPASLTDYLLHRLKLDRRLETGRMRPKIVRSDITTVRNAPVTQRVRVGGRDYEIRIFAESSRG